VRAARLGVSAGHVEAAEGMCADHGAGAFAVEIEIARLEFIARALQLFARTGVNGAGQPELGVVGDVERVIEIARLDYGQHRPEDLFLSQPRGGSDVSNDSGLDEVALARLPGRTAAVNEPAFLLADLDVIQNTLHRLLIDHRTHGLVFCGIAHGDLADPVFQALEEDVINLLVDDGARAGRALLPLEAESGGGHAFDSGVKVGVSIDDDGVFSAHLQDGAFDPLLAWTGNSRALVNVEPDLLRSGESDEARERVLHQARAEAGARAGAEIHHAVGHAGLLQDLKELG